MFRSGLCSLLLFIGTLLPLCAHAQESYVDLGLSALHSDGGTSGFEWTEYEASAAVEWAQDAAFFGGSFRYVRSEFPGIATFNLQSQTLWVGYSLTEALRLVAEYDHTDRDYAGLYLDHKADRLGAVLGLRHAFADHGDDLLSLEARYRPLDALALYGHLDHSLDAGVSTARIWGEYEAGALYLLGGVKEASDAAPTIGFGGGALLGGKWAAYAGAELSEPFDFYSLSMLYNLNDHSTLHVRAMQSDNHDSSNSQMTYSIAYRFETGTRAGTRGALQTRRLWMNDRLGFSF
ncbi:hypothetical protein [Celeribacter baekdonensis]|uniref:hypothetical protein n=1 Tax=Celeribacter baekdonensis TaxID=875171 RepID=UPI0030DA7ADB